MIEKFYRKTGSVTELCLKIGCSQPFANLEIIKYLFSEAYESHLLSKNSFLGLGEEIVELGPRLNFETPFSTNAVAICHSCGITDITRIEVFRRYYIANIENSEQFIESRYDRMTECAYPHELETFEIGIIRTCPG